MRSRNDAGLAKLFDMRMKRGFPAQDRTPIAGHVDNAVGAPCRPGPR